ncbi:DUF6538 domain-containing protein [Ancylobacter sp. FA202]|uniref:DUF6538 domain-containing protein n=1 Tax=Ancylobacter sp. FA202 TaxID=1111106 RepID=UPI0012DE5790|nr:DUF6538 domain-containing protein [Ancylobacter sp. FA202]
MALRMARPFRHSKTGIFWFRKAVPVTLRERVGKREISQSLATRDPDTAKELIAPLDAEWNARFKSLQSGVSRMPRFAGLAATVPAPVFLLAALQRRDEPCCRNVTPAPLPLPTHSRLIF